MKAEFKSYKTVETLCYRGIFYRMLMISPEKVRFEMSRNRGVSYNPISEVIYKQARKEYNK